MNFRFNQLKKYYIKKSAVAIMRMMMNFIRLL
jgi:hypothetical protein